MNRECSHHNIMKAIRAPTSCGFHGLAVSTYFVLEFCLCHMHVTASGEICEGVTSGLQGQNSKSNWAELFWVLVKAGLAKWEGTEVYKGLYSIEQTVWYVTASHFYAAISFLIYKLGTRLCCIVIPWPVIMWTPLYWCWWTYRSENMDLETALTIWGKAEMENAVLTMMCIKAFYWE